MNTFPIPLPDVLLFRAAVSNKALAGIVGLMLLLLPAFPASAQTATVQGFVSDATDGTPMELVNVVLSSDGELVVGAVTNPDGIYLINRIPTGNYDLTFSFIGYRPFTRPIALRPGERETINVALEPDASLMDEVVVESERTTGAARVTAGQQTIRPEDIELIPTPDVTGDLVGYLNTLPGIVSVGDRGGQLFIRGGEPAQNHVQLDRMTLYQPFHILGFYSAFPADILNRTDVYAGGYGSRFGGRLSSVIDVLTRPGNNRSFAGSGSISPFMGALRLEGPIIKNRVSFLASARESVIEQGASRYIDAPMPFNFGDVFGKLHAEVNSRSRLSFSYLRTHDSGRLVEEFEDSEIVSEDLRWKNRAAGFRWVLLPRFAAVAAEINYNFSGLTTEQGPLDAPSRRSTIKSNFIGIDISFFGEKVDGYTGLSIRLSELDSQLGGVYQNVELRKTSIDEVAQYVEFDFKMENGLSIRPGLRFQFYQTSIDPKSEPRLRLVWERGIHQFSAATGIYHQEITGLTDRRDAASVFTAWTNIPRPTRRNVARDIRAGRLPRAIHYIAGYRISPSNDFELSIEGFRKDIKNLFVAEWTAFPLFTTNVQPADGRVWGFDVRAELSKPKFYATVNYGLSNTRYTAEQFELQLWYGVERLDYRPPHDRRHQVNALTKWTLGEYNVNVKWEFGSGLPFNRALGFDAFVLVDDIVDVSDIPGAERVIYERPYNGLLPTYHRLDVSVDRTFETKFAEVTMQASVINSYNRRNLFYLDVFTLQRVDQLPLVPSLGLKVEF